VDPSGLLKGAGGSGSVSDSIGGTVGKIKDADDVKDSYTACMAKAKKICPFDIGISKDALDCKDEQNLAESNCRGKAAFDSTLGKFINWLPDSMAKSQPKDTNITTPSSDNNSTGKESASDLSWIITTDENGTIKNTIFHCN